MHRARHTLGAATLLFSACILSASAARAAGDDKVRCAAAYEQAQVLRRQDKLSAARTQLSICEQTCPRTLASDCTKWRTEVEALMPTVRLRATDGHGHPVAARVLIDGEVLTDAIGDAPVAVDSGDHTFRFEGAGGATADVRVSLHGGERDKEIEAVLVLAHTPVATTSSRSIPTASYVLGAIGIVGLGLGGALSIKGHVDASHLQSTCAPACAPHDVDSIATLYNVGWVSAGIGAASLVAALIVWRPWADPDAPAAAGIDKARFFVAPTAGGTTLGWTFE